MIRSALMRALVALALLCGVVVPAHADGTGDLAFTKAKAADRKADQAKAGLAKIMPAQKAIWLPRRVAIREVMASPPAITVSTSHTISSPRGWLATAPINNRTTLNPLFRYRRGSGPVAFGQGFPNYFFSALTGVNYGSQRTTNMFGTAVVTNGGAIEFMFRGSMASIWVKIDGQYASLTPSVIPNDGNIYYLYVPLSAGDHEVEVISTETGFGGAFTPQTATLLAAPKRGPTMIVLGDSFGESAGASNALNGYVQVMADALGWDDVRPAAVGSTGLVAGPAPKLPWTQRIATDVIPFKPDVLLIQGSINDGQASPTALAVAAQSAIDQVRTGSPGTFIIMSSILANKGPGYLLAVTYRNNAALKAVAAANGIPFIDLLDPPIQTGYTPIVTTLAAAASAGATTLSLAAPAPPGSVIKFADGAHCYIKALSQPDQTGNGPFSVTVDNLPMAQASGAAVTVGPPGLWTGDGRVGGTTGNGNTDLLVNTDGTHPSDAGHLAIGNALATGVYNAVNGDSPS